MAQTLTIFRSSYTVPIAIGIMALGVFLLCMQKISERCFICLMVLGCVALFVPLLFAGLTESSIAQLNNNTSQLNLLAEKEKTKQLTRSTIIKFLSVAGSIISFITLLLSKIHFGH